MTRGGLAILAVMLVIAFTVADARCSADAGQGDAYPAEVTIYTYDGPLVFAGPLVAFRYGTDYLRVVVSEYGDGIFRADFES